MENEVKTKIEYILIVTEDSRSLNIFLDEKIKNLKLNKKASVAVEVRDSEKAGGSNPETLVNYGLQQVSFMKRKNKIVSHLYVVMDVDDFDTAKNNFELRTQAQRLLDNEKVKGIPIISNEVSEIWYILHFKNEANRAQGVWRATQQERNPNLPDAQISDKILAGYLGKKYQKTKAFSKVLYKTLEDKEPIAIENAKYLHDFHTKKGNVIIENYYYGNPSSQVYILIEHLNELAFKK